MNKRPGEGGGGGGPAKRPPSNFERPEFLDDDGEDVDVFVDELDAQAADFGAGARPHWGRPQPPLLDPAQHALGASGRAGSAC